MLSFTLFKVGEQTFAYETADVVKTVNIDRVFMVPRVPSYVKGLVNLRNTAVPIIDMGVLLWDKPLSTSTAIMLYINESLVGILVDKVLGIVNVSQIKDKGQVDIVDVREDLVRGVFDRDGDVVFVLDLDSVLTRSGRITSKRAKKRKGKAQKSQKTLAKPEEGFVVFPIGNEWYAFPVGEVGEIINHPRDISPMPRSPEYIKGVFLLRGEETMLVSLRKLLGVESSAPEQRVIIVRGEKSNFGIAVDDVKEIRWVHQEEVIPMERDPIKGIIALEKGDRLVSVLEIGKLLENEDIEGMTDERDREGYTEEVQEMKSFVLFNVGGVDMAVPIEKVREVIEVEDPTPLPGAPEYIKGMYNLRNSVIAIVDLSRKLGIDSKEETGRVVVLGDMPVGLMVNKLRGILKTEEENIQPVEDLTGVEEKLLEGIIKTESGGIIFILDVDTVVQEEDLKLLKEEVGDE